MTEATSQIVRQVLSREDIKGLLSLGAPPDEYHREAELVVQTLQSLLSTRPRLAPRQ